jgi:hypothetical protein
MLKLKCTCGKPLAPGNTKCGLCAMGLTPSRKLEVAADYQTGVAVKGREDSGKSCARCQGRLSFAEVAKGSCGHCHASIAGERVPAPIERRPSLFARKPEQRATVKLWPEKAPIR